MITLYRFPISHFSEKARLFLDYKKVGYQVVDWKVGLPQLRLLRMTGQRKVPVIDHDGRMVFDSTEIGLYLDRAFPDAPRLVPDDERLRREVLELEDRIDRGFGVATALVWLRRQAYEPEMERMLRVEVAGIGNLGAKGLAALLRSGEKGFAHERFDRAEKKVRAILEELTERLRDRPYLVGDQPTLADFAAAGLALHLKFPHSRFFPFPELQGRGVRGIADDPTLRPFFEWRDQLYADFAS